jgi:hypothetical protein
MRACDRKQGADSLGDWSHTLSTTIIGALLPIVVILISLFYQVRGDETHPQTAGSAIYTRLVSVDPMSLVDSIAEYIVRFLEAEGTHYPYWIFGWNYLNPRPNSYEIIPSNNDQFCFSLQTLALSAHGRRTGRTDFF